MGLPRRTCICSLRGSLSAKRLVVMYSGRSRGHPHLPRFFIGNHLLSAISDESVLTFAQTEAGQSRSPSDTINTGSGALPPRSKFVGRYERRRSGFLFSLLCHRPLPVCLTESCVLVADDHVLLSQLSSLWLRVQSRFLCHHRSFLRYLDLRGASSRHCSYLLCIWGPDAST
jgi:hypothetical protein